MTSTLPPLAQACSGAVGSAASSALVYPLDLAAARLQTTRNPRLRGLRGALAVLQHAVRSDGWAALYDGLVPDTLATLLSNFCYFYAYTLLRRLLLRHRLRGGGKDPARAAAAAKQALAVGEELALGFVAGVASRAVSTPLSVVTVRLQTGAGDEDADADGDDARSEKAGPRAPHLKSGLAGAVQAIYAADGLGGFWKGFETATLLSLNPALAFALFQLYRRLLPLRLRAAPPAGHAFVGAAGANAIAITLLYPLILAKTRLQSAPSPSAAASESSGGPTRKSGTRALLSVLCAAYASGSGGLYRGLAAQLLKGVLGQGCAFVVKQRIEQAVVRFAMARRAGP